MLFADRFEAGARLAARLQHLRPEQPVVLAVPRGGVAVASAIARAFAAPLDVVLACRIAASGQEELAVGALAEGDPPELVLDEDIAAWRSVSRQHLEIARQAAIDELERRRQLYLPERPHVEIAGRTAIVVDDGLATGMTMLAALRSTKRRRPARVVVAVPVAPEDTLERLRVEVDEVVCLHTPVDFYAVGQFYRAFPSLRDDEVVALLQQVVRPSPFAD